MDEAEKSTPDVTNISPREVSQQWAFAAAEIQDGLMWSQLSRRHEGVKTGRAVLKGELLEDTKP
jgi:hypothetical protein